MGEDLQKVLWLKS
jgi:FKBP12-rapamycin complex-associated protein